MGSISHPETLLPSTHPSTVLLLEPIREQQLLYYPNTFHVSLHVAFPKSVIYTIAMTSKDVFLAAVLPPYLSHRYKQ